ncbi:hypothetical protein T06_16441 [Trichinella sp. T6]|nr:hypothetical protein T06_16441 [Trichinella sp. T6]
MAALTFGHLGALSVKLASHHQLTAVNASRLYFLESPDPDNEVSKLLEDAFCNVSDYSLIAYLCSIKQNKLCSVRSSLNRNVRKVIRCSSGI